MASRGQVFRECAVSAPPAANNATQDGKSLGVWLALPTTVAPAAQQRSLGIGIPYSTHIQEAVRLAKSGERSLAVHA